MECWSNGLLNYKPHHSNAPSLRSFHYLVSRNRNFHFVPTDFTRLRFFIFAKILLDNYDCFCILLLVKQLQKTKEV